MTKLSVWLVASLCVGVAAAQEVAEAQADAVADGEATAEAAVETAAERSAYEYETAVVRAVEGVRAMAAKNPNCWIATPEYPQKVASWETRKVRYREVTYKQPIYEYESYEALVPGASAGQLVKRTQQRVKGIKGYREAKHLVYDTNGPIEREQRYPIYEKGTAPLWRWGELGVNAMAVYALRAAGVPETDGLITPTSEGLAAFVRAFDMPDATWDLAWLTAAFAVLPGKTFEDLTARCASKLMDGQVASGECAGMWGPLSVNPAVVAAIYKVLVDLSDDKDKVDKAVKAEMQAALKGVKVSKKMSKAEEEQIRLEGVLLALQREGSRVTQLGLRLFLAMGSHHHDHLWGLVNVEASDSEQARMQGHPYLIHNQALVDMESTAVALFALRVAAQQKRLPPQTWRPTLEAAGRALAARAGVPPPRVAADVIRLAEKAVTGARLPDRRWHEANRQQAVTDYVWLKAVPQVKGRLPALDSPVSAVTTLRGFAAFNNASFFKAMTPLPVPYDIADFMKILDEALTWDAPVKGEPEARANAARLVATGMLAAPVPGVKRAPPAAGWLQVAQKVLAQQNKESGLWGHPTRRILWLSSGLWARKAVLPQLRGVQMAEYYPQAHLTPALTQPTVIAQRYAVPEWAVSTAGALLLLAEGLDEEWSCPTEGVVYEPPEAAP